jgi:peptidoglycan/xylan/chitin deacetylase (PgdA/CDA1 family)
MTKYQKVTTVFLLAMFFMVAADILIFKVPVIFYVLTMVGYILMLAYGSIFIGSNFYIQALCKVESCDEKVCLTFDDGPVSGTTEQILDILRDNGVKATFFCIGNRMEQNPQLVARIVKEGHQLSNHSYSHHFLFDLFPFQKMSEEIKRVNLAIKEATGVQCQFFRPPYGVTTPVLSKAIIHNDMVAVGWSIRSFDTVTSEPEKLFKKVTHQLKGGDIILMHDTCEVTVKALPDIIKHILQKGLHPIRVDEMKINGHGNS